MRLSSNALSLCLLFSFGLLTATTTAAGRIPISLPDTVPAPDVYDGGPTGSGVLRRAGQVPPSRFALIISIIFLLLASRLSPPRVATDTSRLPSKLLVCAPYTDIIIFWTGPSTMTSQIQPQRFSRTTDRFRSLLGAYRPWPALLRVL